jgi:FkbM family methyltransferase
MDIRRRLKRFVLPALLPRLNPHWHQLSYLKRLLIALEIDCVLDVGANAGQYAQELRALGYPGLILSFEPDPSTFQQLQAMSQGDDGWFAFNIALGAKHGELELNIMKRSEFNSFRQPKATASAVIDSLNSVVRHETVPVHTLTDYLPPLAERFGFKRTFLKMDTQGFDSEVFEGANGVLDKIVGLQSEIAVVRLYEGVPAWSEMIRRYEAAGFDLSNLFSNSPACTRLLEFDCYMTRRVAVGDAM